MQPSDAADGVEAWHQCLSFQLYGRQFRDPFWHTYVHTYIKHVIRCYNLHLFGTNTEENGLYK